MDSVLAVLDRTFSRREISSWSVLLYVRNCAWWYLKSFRFVKSVNLLRTARSSPKIFWPICIVPCSKRHIPCKTFSMVGLYNLTDEFLVNLFWGFAKLQPEPRPLVRSSFGERISKLCKLRQTCIWPSEHSSILREFLRKVLTVFFFASQKKILSFILSGASHAELPTNKTIRSLIIRRYSRCLSLLFLVRSVSKVSISINHFRLSKVLLRRTYRTRSVSQRIRSFPGPNLNPGVFVSNEESSVSSTPLWARTEARSDRDRIQVVLNKKTGKLWRYLSPFYYPDSVDYASCRSWKFQSYAFKQCHVLTIVLWKEVGGQMSST